MQIDVRSLEFQVYTGILSILVFCARGNPLARPVQEISHKSGLVE
jgi:hypothetical protein